MIHARHMSVPSVSLLICRSASPTLTRYISLNVQWIPHFKTFKIKLTNSVFFCHQNCLFIMVSYIYSLLIIVKAVSKIFYLGIILGFCMSHAIILISPSILSPESIHVLHLYCCHLEVTIIPPLFPHFLLSSTPGTL
jgi:hypothetical protein